MSSRPHRDPSKLPTIALSATAGAVCRILLSRNFFEPDKGRSEEITLARWKRPPFGERVIGRTAGLLRSQM